MEFSFEETDLDRVYDLVEKLKKIGYRHHNLAVIDHMETILETIRKGGDTPHTRRTVLKMIKNTPTR